jgi:hypothetical protein
LNVVTSNTITVNETTTLNGLTVFNKNYIEKHSYVGIASNNATINVATASAFTINLSSNVEVLNITSIPSSTDIVGFSLFIKIEDPVYTVSWPESVRWQQNTEPQLSVGAGDIDLFSFITYDGGTNWFAVTAGQGF